MDFKNCKRCGKIHYGRGPICKACEEKDEEVFQIVRTFLKENPNCPMTVVSKETGVSVKVIERFLRDGRLEITEGIADYLRCLKCGQPIKVGKYCKECSNEVNKEMKSIYNNVTKKSDSDDAKKSGAKMHLKRISEK